MSLFEQYLGEAKRQNYRQSHNLDGSSLGHQLLESPLEVQRDFVMEAVAWIDRVDPRDNALWLVHNAISRLFRRSLPYTEADLLRLFRSAKLQVWIFGPYANKILERYLQTNELSPQLSTAVEIYLSRNEVVPYFSTRDKKRYYHLQELLGINPNPLQLLQGDPWADAALAFINGLESTQREAWIGLLNHCSSATASAPSAKWRKSAKAFIDTIGPDACFAQIEAWLPLGELARPESAQREDQWGQVLSPLIMVAENADMLKGLIWLCADRPEPALVRVLASLAIASYKKLPGLGPRNLKLGNACLWALGQMPGTIGITQLVRIRLRVRLANVQKLIEKTLQQVAEKQGLSRDELEELLIPTHGLEDVGLLRETLGEVVAELRVTGTNTVELSYTRADGKAVTAPPKAVKAEYADEIKALTAAVKDIKQLLPSQRDRIEQFYLNPRVWSYETWRERYCDHPLVGTVARRLIWRFELPEGEKTAIWRAGALRDFADQIIAPSAETQVRLWHPLDSPTDDVLAWRRYLVEHELVQAFKQAHREVYVLTDAERNTRTYSNRFAAHILRQHQFNALCAARGWKNALRLMVDDSYPPAQRMLKAWNLRAEYWVEGIGDNYGQDSNDTGTYLRLVTDQVRFYPIDAAEHYAHAGGGGYGRYNGAMADPLPLEQIPALVFSEIMRDVDLFVGVASVGNDPTWNDGGPDGRFINYWQSYSFGDLSPTAQTRRAILEPLIKRLKIAARSELTDKFLVVRGDIRSYKIHLGSGNILMEPNDQYLCIVPSRSSEPKEATAGQFLPFEGDQTLAVILSKAFLLANDTKITDPSIVSQIKR